MPPERPGMPIPPPEVEAALARLRQPGAATAAVAGEITVDDRVWSPLVEPSEDDEYRKAIKSIQEPPPHPSLRGPILPKQDDGPLPPQYLDEPGGHLRQSLRGYSELVEPSKDVLRRSLEAQEAQVEIAAAHATQRLNNAVKLGVPPTSALPVVIETEEQLPTGAKSARCAAARPSSGGHGRRPASASSEGRTPPSAGGARPGSSPPVIPELEIHGLQPPGTPGLDTLVRRAEERLRSLQLAEATPTRDPQEVNASLAAQAIAANAFALGTGTGKALPKGAGPKEEIRNGFSMGTATLMRGSLPADSAYVPLGSVGTNVAAGRAHLADGELPEWLQPANTHGGRGATRAADGQAEESREALLSRGSSITSAQSKAESTTVAVVRRTEQQLKRLAEYEQKVAGLCNVDDEGVFGAPSRPLVLTSKRNENIIPPISPSAASENGNADIAQGTATRHAVAVEERMAWLRQLEAQLGMEGVVMERPSTAQSPPDISDSTAPRRVRTPRSRQLYSVEADHLQVGRERPRNLSPPTPQADQYNFEKRMRKLTELEETTKEKEELDELLAQYVHETGKATP